MVTTGLFFVVERANTHILVDTAEKGKGSDIAKVIAGVTDIDIAKITLKRPADEARSTWEDIDLEKELSTYGYTKETAKPEKPEYLAYVLPEDDGKVEITPRSEPEVI